MADIVERLRDYANDDHERLCQGRTYSCSCGYDDKRDPLMTEAADTITALRAEVEEYDRLFDLRRAADMRAIKRWQAAHPGNDLNWPDHADLVVWLLERDAALRAENEKLRAALRDATEQMEWLAKKDPHCMGWVGPLWPSTTPAIKVAAEKARAALEEKQ